MSNDKNYCIPYWTSQSSSEKAVCKRISELLDTLSELNAWRLEECELRKDAYVAKMKIIDGLKKSGWKVTTPNDRYKVEREK